MTLQYPEEVNSNQKMELTLHVESNSNTTIENLLVSAIYPLGFSFQNATPEPAFDQNVWSIGDLKPNESRDIVIGGIMQGQNEEEKTFRFTAGSASQSDEKLIGVDFIAVAETTKIKKPFFTSELSIDNSEDNPSVVYIGNQVSGSLLWTNSIPVTIHDAVIEIYFSGNALDRNKITASQQGFYDSLNNRVFWDKRTRPELAEVAPGQTGKLQFDFYTLKATPQTLAALRAGEVNLQVKITGQRFSETEAPEELSYSYSRNVRVVSEAQFNPRLVYSVGPFTNTGPVPPKAEKATTYTVIWSITNSFNNLAQTTVTAQLPPYVSWVGTKSPSSENVIYNKDTNQVVWDVGNVKAGIGYVGSSPREVAFQVSVVPSLGQVNKAPDVILEQQMTAQDLWTGKEIEINRSPLSTRLTTDPQFDFGDGTVVK